MRLVQATDYVVIGSGLRAFVAPYIGILQTTPVLTLVKVLIC
jgi:hypothetical protein